MTPQSRTDAHRFILPTHFIINLLFVLIATALIGLIGWVVSHGLVPWVALEGAMGPSNFSGTAQTILMIWMATALVITFVLPVGILAMWWRDAQVRTLLAPYALLLLIQMPTEMIGAQIFFPNIVVFTGFIYTSYRIYQLWYAQKLARQFIWETPLRARVTMSILLAGLCFWSCNSLFLIWTFTTRIVQW
ncbi:MAG: hypothetical protein AAGF95_26150 [Chloroflexota bacterium]